MAVFIVGGQDPDASVEALELDATISTNINLRNKVTSHPVEDRASISDHAFNENVQIEVVAVATNTPVPSKVKTDNNILTNTGSEFDPSRVKRAYDILRRWYKERTPITLVSDVESFQNCVITDLKVPRSVEWANAVQFSISFEQIRVASTRQALLLVAEPQRAESTPETKEQGKQVQINTTAFGLIGGGGPTIDTLTVGG